jgi:hypothetical protein
MCISPAQMKAKEDARKESEEKTMGVNATGEKSALDQYSSSSNQINNE